MEATQVPNHRWVGKDLLYIMKYYSAIKKNEIFLIVTPWMDPEGIKLSETSQSENKIKEQT